MEKKTERFHLRVTPSEKEFLESKSEELGFNSVTAFLLSSARDRFTIDLDISPYREVAKEINYIGKNINNLIRHIFTTGIYSNYDIDYIKRKQQEAIDKLNQDYSDFRKLRKKYRSSNMTLKDTKKLVEELSKNEMEIPKKYILEEIYEGIRKDIVFIAEAINDSPEQGEEIADYVFEYMYGETLFSLDEKVLKEFADEIFFFAEKLKVKFLKMENYFDDDDWFDLKDILDKYEVY